MGSGEGWRAEAAIAGNEVALQALRELIMYPFLYAAESRRLGLKWPRGLLLYGPPGTGKTSLVHAVVRECDAHLTAINPFSVHRAHAGESEKYLREAFSEAYSLAASGKPSVIFIDEIDAICPRRNTRVDGIDLALRRPGRFDSEVEVNVPTVEDRLKILELYTKNLYLHDDVNLRAISASCHGYVGADIEALCREAARFAYRRLSGTAEDTDVLMLQMEDWDNARAEVRPSITRGVTKEISEVTWDDIGGLKDLKKKLQQAVEWPIKHIALGAEFRKFTVSWHQADP